MADASYVKRLKSKGFTENLFGYVKDIPGGGTHKRILLVIDPGKNTAREPGELNPHPGEIWQCIVHRGYADIDRGDEFDRPHIPSSVPSTDKNLKYTYRGLDGRIHEEFFGEGDVFASTLTDDMDRAHGESHCNANVSDRPIILEVSRKLEKKS